MGQFKSFFLLYTQKLSRRAKTFWVAMPPCHPGFWASVWTAEIHIEDKSGDDECMALLEADTVDVERILVYFNNDIGEETWHRLAGNLKENPDIWMDQAIISREVMVERMKDDIKSIWDATGGRIYLGDKEVTKKWQEGSILVDSEDWADWEAAWAKLKEISNMTLAEFKAEVAKAEELRQAHEKDLEEERLRKAHEKDPEDSSSAGDSCRDKESEVSPAVLMAGILRREVSLDSSSEESSEEEKESNHAPQLAPTLATEKDSSSDDDLSSEKEKKTNSSTQAPPTSAGTVAEEGSSSD